MKTVNKLTQYRVHSTLNREFIGAISKPLASTLVKSLSTGSEATLAKRLQTFLKKRLVHMPWKAAITDWTGNTYELGGNKTHWSNNIFRMHIKTVDAGRDLFALDGLRFLERFLENEVDISGVYLIQDIKEHMSLAVINPAHLISNLARILAFQNIKLASVNVSNHYDMPEKAVRRWLDSEYASYSCAIFEDPNKLNQEELLQIGKGQEDNWDSLEKAQWRKFKDAAEWLNPADGETTLDVGCGYPGYLRTHMEMFPNAGKVVGWTHSENQVRYGIEMLKDFDSIRYELNHGDYREEFENIVFNGKGHNNLRKLLKKPKRVFDHIQSTGMISHVGPRKGLIEYVRNCRGLIKKGGRYVHHSLMNPYNLVPLDLEIGSAFCKKYVWPGISLVYVSKSYRST